MKIFNKITDLNTEVNCNYNWIFPKITVRDLCFSFFLTLIFCNLFYINPTKTTLALIPVVSMSLFPSWGSITTALLFPIKISINIITNPVGVINTIFKESYNYSSSTISGVGKIIYLYKEHCFKFPTFAYKENEIQVSSLISEEASSVVQIINGTLKNLREEELSIKTNRERYISEGLPAATIDFELQRLKRMKHNYYKNLEESYLGFEEIKKNSEVYKRYNAIWGSSSNDYPILSRRITETLCKVAISTGTTSCILLGINTYFPNINPNVYILTSLTVLGVNIFDIKQTYFNDLATYDLYKTKASNPYEPDNYTTPCMEAYENANKDVKKIKQIKLT